MTREWKNWNCQWQFKLASLIKKIRSYAQARRSRHKEKLFSWKWMEKTKWKAKKEVDGLCTIRPGRKGTEKETHRRPTTPDSQDQQRRPYLNWEKRRTQEEKSYYKKRGYNLKLCGEQFCTKQNFYTDISILQPYLYFFLTFWTDLQIQIPDVTSCPAEAPRQQAENKKLHDATFENLLLLFLKVNQNFF